MKKATLKKCEEKLLQMKEDILASLKEREKEALAVETDVQDETDIAQEATSKSVSMLLADKDNQRLTMINSALEKIKNGTYGICIDTEEEIEEKRLLANPLAIRSISAQEEFERDQKQRVQPRPGSGSSSMFDGSDD